MCGILLLVLSLNPLELICFGCGTGMILVTKGDIEISNIINNYKEHAILCDMFFSGTGLMLQN